MEIKTIYIPASAAGVPAFDNCVNEALQEGWKLVKRELIQPKAQPNIGGTYFNTMLYAELERSTSDCETSTLNDIKSGKGLKPLQGASASKTGIIREHKGGRK